MVGAAVSDGRPDSCMVTNVAGRPYVELLHEIPCCHVIAHCSSHVARHMSVATMLGFGTNETTESRCARPKKGTDRRRKKPNKRARCFLMCR
jgi:hypothetical protein